MIYIEHNACGDFNDDFSDDFYTAVGEPVEIPRTTPINE